MTRPLQILVLLLVLLLEGRAQTFVEGDYQINRRRDSPAAGFEVAELLAGSNITITWDNTAKTATLSGSAGTGGTSITTLGTITTGTWNATPIADSFIASAATWNAKQAALVSGTNLKTVNGTSLLGSGNLAVDQTITLTGDVTGTGTGSFATIIAGLAVTTTKVANDAITYAKMQNVSNASRLLGRGQGSGAGDVQEIQLVGLSMSGTTLTGGDMLKGTYDQLNTGFISGKTGVSDTDGLGGVGGTLKLSGGDATSGAFTGEDGGPGGSIDLRGGNSPGSSVVGGAGGSLVSTGSSDAGYNGGSLNMSGGASGNGGSITTFNGGGGIDTTGQGAIGLGVSGTRTNLFGGATADRSISFQDSDGTLAFLADITGTNSGTNTGDVTLAGENYLSIVGQTITAADIALGSNVSGTLGVANGGSGANTLAANAVLLGNGTSALQTVAPSTSGNVLTSNGTTWTSAAPTTGANPAGSGSELQFRSTGTTFGAVTNSSVSGGTLTLGNAEALATTPTAYLTLRNTTAATSGNQQVSPSFVLEGQGWKTTATAASQTVRFRQNILPVQGAANPTATYRIQSEINNTGTWTDRVTISSGGIMTLGAFPGGFAVGTNNYLFSVANGIRWQMGGADTFGTWGAQAFTVSPNAVIGFPPSSGDIATQPDAALGRDAPGVLAQRNGTNAQSFRVYETDSGSNDEYLEFSAASGTNLIRPQATGTGTASVVRYHTTTTVFWTSGSGSPESVVTAPVGSLYTRTDGGASTTLYVKESGTGSTGWVAK